MAYSKELVDHYEKPRNGIDKRKWHLENQVERWIRTQL